MADTNYCDVDADPDPISVSAFIWILTHRKMLIWIGIKGGKNLLESKQKRSYKVDLEICIRFVLKFLQYLI